jgi:hypothetical protein
MNLPFKRGREGEREKNTRSGAERKRMTERKIEGKRKKKSDWTRK